MSILNNIFADSLESANTFPGAFLWGYQDFAAGSVLTTSIILTANENGDDASFDISKITGGSAAIFSGDNPLEYVYTSAGKFFGTLISVSSHTGANITINKIPNPATNIRIWYKILSTSIPTDYAQPPLALQAKMLENMDAILLSPEDLNGGDGINYNSVTGEISANIDVDNIKFTSGKINTIQNIDITADVIFNSASLTSLTVDDGNILGIGSGTSPIIGVSGAGTRLMWYPRKAAFRAGNVDGDQWDDSNIGYYSVATGEDNEASGTGAVAMGIKNTASSQAAVALGFDSTASGLSASTLGASIVAKSAYEVVVGKFNTDYIPLQTTTWDPADRLFTIGNGEHSGAKSDALTILKGGNTGIGISTPTELVHVEEGNLLNKGTFLSSPTLSISGSGSRMFFYPRKSAFRAGNVNSTQWDDVNIGNYSIAMGRNNTASGSDSVVLGFNSTVSASHAIALGRDNVVSNQASALGTENTVTAQYSTAIGYLNNVSGASGSALGFRNTVTGEAAAIGSDNTITSNWAGAIGRLNIVGGDNSIAMGYNNTVSGSSSAAIGISNNLTVNKAYALGESNIINAGSRGVALGYNNTVGGESLAMGSQNVVNHNWSVAGGRTNTINSPDACTFGRNNTLGSTAQYSAVFGYNNTAVDGAYALVGGRENIITSAANYCFSAGYQNEISAWYSATIGRNNEVSGAQSIALGALNTITSQYSFAAGYQNDITWNHSFAAGRWNTISNPFSGAIGDGNTVSGQRSFAAGYQNVASGSDYTIAMGRTNTASGYASIAMGDTTTASKGSATAIGNNVSAISTYETVMGRWNTSYTPVTPGGWGSTDRLFSIGNGTATGSRSDAIIILKNGNFGFNGASFGGGVKTLFIANRTIAPTSNPTGGGILYCESGALKYRGTSGTTTTIANA